MPASIPRPALRAPRPLLLAVVALLAVACERSDPIAPQASAPRPAVAPPPAWLAPTTNALWSGSFSFDELPLVGNVSQGTASGTAINEAGIVVGSTQGYLDGVGVSVMRATRWSAVGPQHLGVLPPYHSGKHSWAMDVNDAGVVVGSSYAGPAAGGCCLPIRGFVWTDGAGMQALASMAGAVDRETRATAINNAGQIVGTAMAADGSYRAVLWPTADASPIDVSVPGSTFTSASDINDAGVVVGGASFGASVSAYRRTAAGGHQLLPGLGGSVADARAINGGGAIVGVAEVADGTQHPFLWTAAGGTIDLGLPPGAVDARARAIDDAGRVVVSAGYIDEGSGDWQERAWLWVAGDWIPLHLPDRAWTVATGINESLVLTGATLSTSGIGSGPARWQVTLTPVAETPTFTFTGFFPPVDNPPALNRAKAGSAIPVKFGLGGDHGLDIFTPGFPASQPIACAAGAALAPVEQTVSGGGDTLRYDAAADQYIWVWATDRSWAGTCRRLTVRLVDGTERFADFSFVR
jgi:probable HAF family extracellular repeat protein